MAPISSLLINLEALQPLEMMSAGLSDVGTYRMEILELFRISVKRLCGNEGWILGEYDEW